MSRYTARIARWSATHPGRAIGLWVLIFLAAVASMGTLLSSALTTDFRLVADTDAKRGFDLLDSRLPAGDVTGGEVVVVRSNDAATTTDSASFRTEVERLRADIAALPFVQRVDDTYSTGDPTLVSRDRRATVMTVRLRTLDEPAAEVGPLTELVQRADASPDFAVDITGAATSGADFNKVSEEDLRKGELYFGIPAALLVLLLVFGAGVAAGVPLLMALTSIPVTLGLSALVGQGYQLSFFITNMVFAMGLALGIDYSLFIVARYREERRRGVAKLDAIEHAGGTSAVAVTFSGAAFVVALTGMLLVPDLILRSLAVGAIIVGVVTVLATLSLLPAVLSLLGDRVDALRLPWVRSARHTGGEYENPRWLAFVRGVMRRPALVLAVVVGLLLLAALPVLNLRTGQQGVALLPDSLPSKQGYLALQRDFPSSGRTDPARIVVDGATDSAAVQSFVRGVRDRTQSEPYGGSRVTTFADQRLTVVDVPLPGDPDAAPARDALKQLRSDIVRPLAQESGVTAHVAGTTAFNIDYARVIDTWLPRVITFVLALTFVLLTLVFRSVVIAAKAVVLNLLSVGAAYGLLVLVFQEGVGTDLLGLTKVDRLESWVPVFLFSVLFALSMDYHVFLISRIREKWAQTGDTREAVAHGIASTGQLITGAALIIVVVFVGFATGELVGFQQMGFGVATALLLDATVIRSIVVPASMALLDRWNWWLPRWLQWLPELQVEGGADRPAAVTVPTAAAPLAPAIDLREEELPVQRARAAEHRGAD